MIAVARPIGRVYRIVFLHHGCSISVSARRAYRNGWPEKATRRD
jgi:hypothetical protein